MADVEREMLPLSGLQHLVFCPRQWALIHLEWAWVENRLIAEGRLLHECVDLRDLAEDLELIAKTLE